MSRLSFAERASLALVPKCSALFSIAGSLWIVIDTIGDKRKQKKLYHRLLFGLSLLDVCFSSFFFASTWPIPKSPKIVWAVGNERTCRVQGFFIQLSSTGYVYNAVLTIYFVLVVRYSIPETTLVRYEAIFHAIPLLFGFGTSITALSMDMYANSVIWCWIGGFNDAYIYRWAFYYAPLWFCFLIVLVGMLMVFWGVRIKERQTALLDGHRQLRHSVNRRHSRTSDASAGSNSVTTTNTAVAAKGRPRFNLSPRKSVSNKRTRQVALQAMLYILAFYLTYFFATVNRIYQQIMGKSSYPLLLLHVIFAPLQGTFNFLIYHRPHMLRLRRANPDWSWWKVIHQSLAEISINSNYQRNKRRRSSSFNSGGRQYNTTSTIKRSSIPGFRRDDIVVVQEEGKYGVEGNDDKMRMSSMALSARMIAEQFRDDEGDYEDDENDDEDDGAAREDECDFVGDLLTNNEIAETKQKSAIKNGGHSVRNAGVIDNDIGEEKEEEEEERESDK